MMKLAAVETKLLTREPGALFSLLIPLFILVVFGSSIEPGDTVLLPMALAIAVGMVGLYLLPTTLATYRERGSCADCPPRRCARGTCWWCS
nr:hypothetical protein GCM10020093_069860 [Planobispora longispora]